MRKFAAAMLAGAALSFCVVGLAHAKGKVIGVSWSNFQEERWKTDEAAMKADHAALNRIALGTQTVSVWKDARELGKKAAEIAALLADGKKMSDVPGVTTFSAGPKKVAMKALLLTPVPITKDNLGVVIEAGWIKKAEVCQGVKPGSVKVCE